MNRGRGATDNRISGIPHNEKRNMTQPPFQQTLVLVKPDALKNSLTGYVLSLLSEYHTGLRYAATKIVQVSKMLAEAHYAEHVGKPFYPSLLEYITGEIHYAHEPGERRVVAVVFHGIDAVAKIRNIAGPTNPQVAREEKPGCIRSLGTEVPLLDKQGNRIGVRMDNLIHASATTPEAEREIKLWFKPEDIPPAMRIYSFERSRRHFYFVDGTIRTDYAEGSRCLVAPEDTAWSSDLEALRDLAGEKASKTPLQAVVAKYLINR